jgi:outer membrane protein assembly factor BamB
MRINMRLVFLAGFFWLMTLSLHAGEPWPEYRGPRGDGTTTSKHLPLTWSETENIRWKTPIHGKAWSSPVVWGKQIWLSSATEDGKKLYALCVDADSGKIVHDVQVFEIAEPKFCHPFNSYASSTSAIEEGYVYVHYGSAGTACLDTKTAAIVWTRQDFPCDHYRSGGSSPILYGDLLILTFDGIDLQYLAAVDKRTGQTVWKTDRKIDYGEAGNADGDLKKAYSTPTVIEIEGVPQLISPSAGATVAYDARTGKEIWHAQTGGYNSAVRPILFHGMVVGHSYTGMQLFAIRPTGRGDVTESHVAWKFTKSTPTRPSPIVVGDLMFVISDGGVISCLEAKTGEQIWQKRLGGDYSASPLYADGRIYFFNQEGVIPVIAAEREFKLLAENKLDDGFMASPAVIDDALILRTRKHLYRVEQSK